MSHPNEPTLKELYEIRSYLDEKKDSAKLYAINVQIKRLETGEEWNSLE